MIRNWKAITMYSLLSAGAVTFMAPPPLAFADEPKKDALEEVRRSLKEIAERLDKIEKKKAPELQYQIIDFNRRSTKAGDALIKALTKLAPTRYFFPLSSMPDLPRLDFVRGGLTDPGRCSRYQRYPPCLNVHDRFPLRFALRSYYHSTAIMQ